MTVFSGVGSAVFNPVTSNSPMPDAGTADGEAAKANETSTGTTESNQSDTGNSTGSDNGPPAGTSNGSSEDNTASTNAGTAPALPFGTSNADAESLINAQVSELFAPDTGQSDSLVRQIVTNAEEAYKMQSMMGSPGDAPRDITPKAPEQPAAQAPVSLANTEMAEMPV